MALHSAAPPGSCLKSRGGFSCVAAWKVTLLKNADVFRAGNRPARGPSGRGVVVPYPARVARAKYGYFVLGQWALPPGIVMTLVVVSVFLSVLPLYGDMLEPDWARQSAAILGPVPAVAEDFVSSNWAGYAVGDGPDANDLQHDEVSYVTGTWKVPAVSPRADGAGSICAVWVGIDGFSPNKSNQTVEQVGTVALMLSGGQTSYYAWYEMYPAALQIIYPSSLKIQAGNSVTASVQYSSSGTFVLSLTDNTTQHTFSISETNASAFRSSAEWIVEPPSGGGAEPLPNFGSVTFTGASATLGATTGPIDDPAWNLTSINFVDTTWGDALYTSAITDVGPGASATSSFKVAQAVPEPGSLTLFAVALLALGGRRCVRRFPFNQFLCVLTR